MRNLKRFKVVAVIAAALLIASGGFAYADDISNNLDASIDAVAEAMPLNVDGANGTTQLYVTPRNGDGKNGCNLTGATTLGLSVSSSNTNVATVSPSSVTFTSCSDTKTLTVTPVAVGSATISVTQTSNNTGGTFNLAPATFAVNVAPPANTAPSIVVAGVTGGASYSKGSVPTATCNVTDVEDGNTSFAATLSPVEGPHAADGIGAQTASCSYTDGGGLVATASESYGIVDDSAPAISYALTPPTPDGLNGWYQGNVSLTWTVSEPQSPNSLETTGCVDQNITADQVATTYSCAATSAGGAASTVSLTIKRDGTAPTVSYTSGSGTQGTNGWYTSNVTATFTGTDALSGPASDTKPATTTGEGSAVTVNSPAFTDNAGNTTAAGAASQVFKVDLTDPTASFDSTIGSVYFGSVPAAPTCMASDATSGPAGCVVSGHSAAVGTHTLTATATDIAGRTGTVTQTYTVLPYTLKGFYSPVDMGGVWNTVKGGSTVPLKFEVFAGVELTSTSAVQSFSTKSVTCPGASAPADEIEFLTTGGTSLRYDATAGQFIQNWATPKKAGTCHVVTMTTQDGSKLSANFILK
jgi:hypothetical protein